MRAGFLGTPAAAIPSLAALVDVADVAVVVTRPDRPAGRGRRSQPPPVKAAAAEWGLPVAQPATSGELLETVRSARLDIGVVVAYGRILKPEVLAATRAGFVNVHFSLLPRWRGAAPVERAIAAGDEHTGVSLMWLDEHIDTGPIVSAIETPIADDETGGSLTARLSHLGAGLLADALPGFVAGELHPADQIHTAATHAAPLRTDEARLDAATDADTLARRVRAYWPRPGAWLTVEGARLRVIEAEAVDSGPAPGEIVAIDAVPVLGTAEGGLVLARVQPSGRSAQSGADWMRGRRGAPATVEP